MMKTPEGNFLLQSLQAEDRILEFNTALFKKLAELHEKYGVTADSRIHGELFLEFPDGTPKEVVEEAMKELAEVTMK